MRVIFDSCLGDGLPSFGGGKSMTYDPNSNKAKQGLIAEQFIADYYKQRGCIVEMYPLATDKNPASVVDMKITTRREAFFVEVKVKRAVFMWGKIFPVYSLETWKRERYQKIQADYGIPVGIFFVDVDKNKLALRVWTNCLRETDTKTACSLNSDSNKKTESSTTIFTLSNFPEFCRCPMKSSTKSAAATTKTKSSRKTTPTAPKSSTAALRIVTNLTIFNPINRPTSRPTQKLNNQCRRKANCRLRQHRSR